MIRAKYGAMLAAAVLALAPLTAGCGAGNDAETLREATTIDGSSGSVGDLRLRNIHAPGPESGSAYPTGSNIPIYLSVVSISSTGSADALVSATSPMGTVTVLPAGPSSIPSPSPSAAGSGGQVPIPAGQAVSFGPGGPSLLLSATSKPVAAGSFVPVTLTFAQAGSVNVQAAVDNGYPASTPSSGITGTATPGPADSTAATPTPLPSQS